LKPDTFQRFSNKTRLVEGRCNDGDEWSVFHEMLNRDNMPTRRVADRVT
jgi:hypothetical protein